MVELKIKKEDVSITLMDKEDVEDLLDEKLDVTDAFSGSYNDLTNKPTIPTVPTIADNLTTNDATQVLSAKQGKNLQDDKISKVTNNTNVLLADGSNTPQSTFASASHNQNLSTINNVSIVAVVVTYTDNTSETINLVKYTGS